MNIGLITLLLVLCVAGLGGTFLAFKQEEKKIKKYEEEGRDELRRSLDYETSSIKSNVSIQVWIYVVTILLSLVAFAIYLI